MSVATTYNKKSHSNIKYNITSSARFGRKLVNICLCSHPSVKLNLNPVFICLNESLLKSSFPLLQTHSFLNNNHMYSLFSTMASYNSKDSTQGDTSPQQAGQSSTYPFGSGTTAQDIINNKLDPAFITGFVDAEGSFMSPLRGDLKVIIM
jgi:hypothetical protein